MPPATSPEVRARQRRISRPWRIAFGVYAVALTIGTHWPRLQLPPETPVSDKTIHVYAFGGLTLLLWQARWIRSIWLLAAMGFAWAALDEYSQGLPGLNRHVSIHDLLANMMGVLIAAAILWAFRPVGAPGGPYRQRLNAMKVTFDELFATARPWVAATITFAAVAAMVLSIRAMLPLSAGRMKWVIVIGGLVGLVAVRLQWGRMWRQLTSDRHVDFRAAAPRFKIAVRPMLFAIVMLVIGFTIILISPIVYAWALNKPPGGAAMGMARSIGTLPKEFTSAVDLTILAVLVAVSVRVYRVGLARHHNRSAICLTCGHDLRGTPVDANGIGRCGECGTPFVRYGTTSPRNHGGAEKD